MFQNATNFKLLWRPLHFFEETLSSRFTFLNCFYNFENRWPQLCHSDGVVLHLLEDEQEGEDEERPLQHPVVLDRRGHVKIVSKLLIKLEGQGSAGWKWSHARLLFLDEQPLRELGKPSKQLVGNWGRYHRVQATWKGPTVGARRSPSRNDGAATAEIDQVSRGFESWCRQEKKFLQNLCLIRPPSQSCLHH